jgi:hypothetical protein
MLANENHVYWLLMQVCQSNNFFSLLYCDYHPIFIVLWPFIALAKDALRQVRWARVWSFSNILSSKVQKFQ